MSRKRIKPEVVRVNPKKIIKSRQRAEFNLAHEAEKLRLARAQREAAEATAQAEQVTGLALADGAPVVAETEPHVSAAE